jgi:hypothetical protein
MGALDRGAMGPAYFLSWLPPNADQTPIAIAGLTAQEAEARPGAVRAN